MFEASFVKQSIDDLVHRATRDHNMLLSRLGGRPVYARRHRAMVAHSINVIPVDVMPAWKLSAIAAGKVSCFCFVLLLPRDHEPHGHEERVRI
jgi:hypothetical protein